MANLVLVAGAWLGGWVWQDVTRELRGRGNDVFPITLTGLADRVHLATPSVDLDTHITDVINTLAFDNLTQVALVGHSYAGAVITGVADRSPQRLAQLIFCDSAPLANGQSMLSTSSPEGQAWLQQQVAEHGSGWRLPPPAWEPGERGASRRGLGDAERALLRQRSTPQAFATFMQPMRLTRDTASPGYRRALILCDDGKRMMATVGASLTAAQPYSTTLGGNDWAVREMSTGHWPMLSAAVELARLLDGVAASRSGA
jgi:pimeloyl-ACP methyl ester carboxylesterase